MKDYDPYNWYWKVAGSTTHVYSSATGDYVPVTNPTFLAWSEDGTVPQSIATEAELAEVLAAYSLRPVQATVLDAYQDSQAKNLTIKVAAKILFNLANEIRVLKGQPQLTPQQFRTYVKGLM